MLRELRASRVAPELVAQKEQDDAAAKQRLAVMQPLSWACGVLPVLVAGAVILLDYLGAPWTIAGSCLFAVLVLPFGVGVFLAVGAARPGGGISGSGALWAMFASIPVAGLALLVTIGSALFLTGPPIDPSDYPRRAQSPAFVGLIAIGVGMNAVLINLGLILGWW